MPRYVRAVRVVFRIFAVLLAAGIGAATQSSAQTLYNGITLPQPWPPTIPLSQNYEVPYYITNPPSVIDIDVGRQLFVDDFLIQQTTMTQTQHQPVMYPLNPVLAPNALDTAEQAIPSSGGAWFDPADNLYKMWFSCGSGIMMCYAYSTDGKNWVRPSIANAQVPNTDEVLPYQVGTVWMDLTNPLNLTEKFKAFAFDPDLSYMPFFYAPDGINWTGTSSSQYQVPIIGDRTTMFFNPFRNVWVDSIKNYLYLPATATRGTYESRIRFYDESPDLMNWTPSSANLGNSFWTGPDVNDPPYEAGGVPPQLYALDGVPYESVIVGLFNWFYPGPGDDDPNNLPGPDLVELGVGFSRDGFYWVRPTRSNGPTGAFIPASNIPGTWDMGNTQSVGGCFLVVGDELWFYFSGRSGPHADANVVAATGLAELRRDGFYSMDAGSTPATLTTRTVQFSGKYMFVNVNDPQGSLTVQILNTSGAVLATSQPITANKTLQAVSWNGVSDLSGFAGQPVQIQFTMTNGELYAFWVSASTSGSSNGYVAAGGPGFTGPTDTLGSAAYPTIAATPEISPGGGEFGSAVTVSITTGTLGATIYYTTNGATPSVSSPVYTGPFQLTSSATVQAIAAAPGMTTSATASATFASDRTPPAVTITSPGNGAAIGGITTVSATATDALGVTSVQFLVDGASIGTVTTAPYTIILQSTELTNASHTIEAVATDTVGNTGSSSITVSVNNLSVGPSNGLAGYWSFDSAYTSGTILFDQSGNNQDATAYSTTSTLGVANQALQFDGATSYVQVPSSESNQLYDLMGDMTLSLWVETTNASRDEALISKFAAGGNGSGYLLRTTPGGTAQLEIGGANVTSGGGGSVVTDVTQINDGNWHHVAVVIHLGSSVSFYVDGELSSTASLNSEAGAAASYLQFGLNPFTGDGTYFTGLMDEVRIYNRALSSAEVLALSQYVTVRPPRATLNQGQAQQFTATLQGQAASSVSWTLAPSGSGAISSNGNYSAPARITSPQTATITATSTASGVNPGSALLTLTPSAAAAFVASDIATGGNWQGVYGADGYSVTPTYQSIPAYATFAVSNELSYTWAPSTTDRRALTIPGSSSRVAATWYSSATFSFDVNCTDGNSHQFALYLLDWDSQGRAETIQIVDANLKNVLDNRSVSNFSNGEYLVWTISGHVTINVTPTAGPNAVVSGAFFGGASSSSIIPTSGTPQSAAVDTAFAPLAVTVMQGGVAVANLPVTFTAPSGGASGTFAGGGNTATANTNVQGVATAPVFTANGTAGGPYSITATASGFTGAANFALTNTAGAAQNIATITGGGQAAQVGNAFGNPFVAKVTDAGGNPVPGVSVTFTAPGAGAGGSFSGAAAAVAITDTYGQATSPAFTANTVAGGPYGVTAAFSDFGGSANFLLINDAGPPHGVAATSGSGQTAQINTSFASPLVATVTDVDGNPVPGVNVTFAAPASGVSGSFGGLTVTAAITNAAGQATSPIFAANGNSGGPYAVTASVLGVAASASFSLTNNAGLVSITVATSTTGPTVTVDGGTPFTGSQTFSWVIGSAHTIAAVASQAAPGLQYTFASWSDGGASSHSVIAPAVPATYTASFNLVEAIFLSPADTTTQGNWQGKYGTDGYSIASSIASIPAYAAFSVQNQSNYTWDPDPSDPRALETGGGARIAAAWYASQTFSFSVNVGTSTHQFGLYAVDWDSKGRSETIEILNPATNTVLDTETISNFVGGVYLNWTISGQVQVIVTSTAGPNCVVSGVFFGQSSGGSSGGGGGSESVTVSPSTTNLTASGTQQFSATVTGAQSQTVTWSIASVNPSTAPAGSFSTTTPGLYSAPASGTIVTAQVTVKATSADGTASGTATVNLTGGGTTGGGSAATFLSKDTTTEGSWQGKYGSDGYSLAGVTTQSIPAYASFSLQNQAEYTWVATSTDPRALQIPGGSGGIAAAWYNPGNFTIDLNVGTSSHQFALYALDWDGQGRAETIQIADANSGATLDTETISNFGTGVYLVWNISGNVTITVTATAGPNAVISAAFFGGAATPATAAFVTEDTTTEGSWQGKYGADGYSLAGVTTQSIPAYASFSVENQVEYTWVASTSDPRALQLPGGSGGIAAAWYSTGSFNFDVNVGTSSHQFSLYAIDWDGQGRSETVQIADANSGATLNTQTISSFGTGVYLVWNITGHVKITVTVGAGPNAVISGAFFH
jgi:hypothetical protein